MGLKSQVILIFCIFFMVAVKCTGQQEFIGDSTIVLAFNPVYLTNEVDFPNKDLEELFILHGKPKLNISQALDKVSRLNFQSMYGILDSLSSSFFIYKLSDSKKSTDIALKKFLFDDNNYKKGTLILLHNAVQLRNSVIGFVIQRTWIAKKLIFKVVSKNCKNEYPYNCRVTIL